MICRNVAFLGQVGGRFIVSGLAHADTAEDPQAAFTRFFSAFVSRNQVQVAAMFAPDVQFYGTVSPALVTTQEGVLDYFTAALDRPDVPEAEALLFRSTLDAGFRTVTFFLPASCA
jgi:hypothetical protein